MNSFLKDSNENTLVLVTKDNITLKNEIVSWIAKRDVEDKDELKDIILPFFVNENDALDDEAKMIFQIVIQLKKIFNIVDRIHMNSEKLKIQFESWIEMANRRMESVPFLD